MAERYDLVVIGPGPAATWPRSGRRSSGMKVACVEKRPTLGGTCLNIGCIPSKALLDSSELYHLAKERFAKHGIKVGNLGLDLPAMLARKDEVVKGLTDGVRFLFRKNKIDAGLRHRPRSPRRPRSRSSGNEGGETTLEAKHILLATGSAPVDLPFLPFDGKTVVSSTEALGFDKVPEHLVVVGGGYIGLELGSVWKRLGPRSRSSSSCRGSCRWPTSRSATLLHKSLTKQGLEFHLETKVTGAKVEGDKVDRHGRDQGRQDARPSTATGCWSPSAAAVHRGAGPGRGRRHSRPEDRQGRRSTPTSAPTSRRSRRSAT